MGITLEDSIKKPSRSAFGKVLFLSVNSFAFFFWLILRLNGLDFVYCVWEFELRKFFYATGVDSVAGFRIRSVSDFGSGS